MKWAGYWNQHEDKPDVPGFVEALRQKRHYSDRYLYRWLSTGSAEHRNVKALAEDLGVPFTWLMCGDDALADAERLIRLRDDLKAGRKKNPNEVKRVHAG